MKKSKDYKRLKKYDFFPQIKAGNKFDKQKDIESLIFAVSLMIVTVWYMNNIVSHSYMWIVWGSVVILFVMLLLSMVDNIKYVYIPHKKVISHLNSLTDKELAGLDLAFSELGIGNVLFTKDFLVATRAFAYYKDIVSIECRSDTVRKLNKKQVEQYGAKYIYEHNIIITTMQNEKWYISLYVWRKVYLINAILEELLIRCSDNVKLIGEFAEQEQFEFETNEINKMSNKLLDTICEKKEDILYDMFDRSIKRNDFKNGVEYIFEIFTGSIICVENCRSHARQYVSNEENIDIKFGIGRYKIATENNEYYMFFAYHMEGSQDQGKISKLKIVPKGSMTEKEFFINDAGIHNKTGIYHPGWDEEMN